MDRMRKLVQLTPKRLTIFIMAKPSRLEEVRGELAHLCQKAEITALRDRSGARPLKDLEQRLRLLAADGNEDQQELRGVRGLRVVG